jgi:hypothetical protein
MDKRMKMNECIYCKNTFSTKTALVRHLKSSVKCIKTRSGTTDVDELTCECGYTTSRRDHLLQHIAICKVSDRIKKYTKTIEDQANIIEDHVKTIEDHVKTIANDCKTIAELKEQVKLLMTRPINPTSRVVGLEAQKSVQAEHHLTLSVLSLNGINIPVRTDGYINATSMCKAGGKEFFDWKRLKSTSALIQAQFLNTGIPGNELLYAKVGNNGGTWLHPDLAIQLAQWISPEFALQVSKWTRELQKENNRLISRVVGLETQKPPVKQLSLNSCTIVIREEDGYINVSELCKAGGKEFKAWMRLDKTKAFLRVLSTEVKKSTSLLITYQTGYGNAQATWAHPQVAINIAQWISPEFDVQVSKWVYELTFTGSVTLGKEKSEEAIQKAFREMIAIDLRPYDKKDVLYFGIFEASNEIEFEGELSEDTMLCKFGVSSDIAMRNGSHEGGKQFPKFRIVHVVEAGSRNDVSVAEKHVKRVVTQMGLRINYGKSKECFMATEEQLRQVLIRADEFVQEEVEEVPDIRLEMRRLDLEGKKMEMAEKKMEMEMAEKKMEKEMESRLIGLFSEGKLTYEQMREMLDK